MSDRIRVAKLNNGTYVHYKLSSKNIKIINSYRIKSKKIMRELLDIIVWEDIYSEKRDRSLESYVREWRTHNILYKIPLKFFRKHCQDCDLTTKENKFRLFVYAIIGRF